MTEYRSVLERAGSNAPQPDLQVERVLRRRDRKRRNQRIRAGVLGLAIAIAMGWLGVNAIRSTSPVPADDPTPPEGLGIFEPVAGRIVYVNGGTDLSVTGGTDLGYDPGLWAVDPNGPSDTTEGPSVADDVASTLVRLDLDEDAVPRGWSSDMTNLHLLGWSSDGTELLFWRWNARFPYEQFLYILHADGSETRLNEEPMVNVRAAFSPDALTGMEANLRFPGPETMESKIFGRLSAWQNWIFQRSNAVGPKGALEVYGTGQRSEFDRRRV